MFCCNSFGATCAKMETFSFSENGVLNMRSNSLSSDSHWCNAVLQWVMSDEKLGFDKRRLQTVPKTKLRIGHCHCKSFCQRAPAVAVHAFNLSSFLFNFCCTGSSYPKNKSNPNMRQTFSTRVQLSGSRAQVHQDESLNDNHGNWYIENWSKVARLHAKQLKLRWCSGLSFW